MNAELQSPAAESVPADDDADGSPCTVCLLCHATPTTIVDDLRDRTQQVIALLGLASCELSVVVVDDARMSEMHERHSGVSGTTDVLTFDLSDEPIETPPADRAAMSELSVEGEVYVCWDEAMRQAVERGHGAADELLLYAVHGLLHLLGFDDHDPDAHARMHAMEDELLEAIGVGRVYDRPSPIRG